MQQNDRIDSRARTNGGGQSAERAKFDEREWVRQQSAVLTNNSKNTVILKLVQSLGGLLSAETPKFKYDTEIRDAIGRLEDHAGLKEYEFFRRLRGSIAVERANLERRLGQVDIEISELMGQLREMRENETIGALDYNNFIVRMTNDGENLARFIAQLSEA